MMTIPGHTNKFQIYKQHTHNILKTNPAKHKVILSICPTTLPLSQSVTQVTGHKILKYVEILVVFFQI